MRGDFGRIVQYHAYVHVQRVAYRLFYFYFFPMYYVKGMYNVIGQLSNTIFVFVEIYGVVYKIISMDVLLEPTREAR